MGIEPEVNDIIAKPCQKVYQFAQIISPYPDGFYKLFSPDCQIIPKKARNLASLQAIFDDISENVFPPTDTYLSSRENRGGNRPVSQFLKSKSTAFLSGAFSLSKNLFFDRLAEVKGAIKTSNTPSKCMWILEGGVLRSKAKHLAVQGVFHNLSVKK